MQLITKSKNNFSQLIFKIGIPFTKRTIRFSTILYRTPDEETAGYTSRCKDGKHIITMDYDGLSLNEVIDELKYLQEYYKLSNFYIWECDRNDSYHAVCLDKFPLYDAIQIVSQTNADAGFKRAPLFFRKKRWVLRNLAKAGREKPEFLQAILSDINNNEISTAHKMFIEKFNIVEMPYYSNEDGLTEIDICNYTTGSNVD